MDTFTLVKQALDASADDPDREGLDPGIRETGRVLAAVQTVVDVLTPPNGGRYVVSFVDMATAATDLSARRIIVSSKPLHDRSLSLVEKAVVVVTFAAHEIGHTIITAPRAAMIREHNPKGGYHAVANLADDIILEPYMADRYPILQDAFAFTGHWVLRHTAKDLPKREHGNWDTTAARFNTLLSATRYGDIPEIVWATRKARDERDWGRGWAARLIAADTRDHATFLALCDEAWVRIRTKDDDEVEAPPPPIEDGPVGPPSDDRGDEPGDDDEDGDESQPGEGEDEDGPDPSQRGIEDDDESDEDDGEGEGEGDPDDDATDEGDDATDGDGEDEGDDDGDGEGEDGDESDGTDDDGESTDWGDESDEHGDSDDPGEGSDDEGLDDESDGPRGNDGEGGGGDADASADDDLRDEDDFDKDEVDQSTHSEAHAQEWDYDAKRDEEAVRAYQNTGTTAFGRHGKMTTTWQ